MLQPEERYYTIFRGDGRNERVVYDLDKYLAVKKVIDAQEPPPILVRKPILKEK